MKSSLEAQQARAALAAAVRRGAPETEVAALRAEAHALYVWDVMSARLKRLPAAQADDAIGLLMSRMEGMRSGRAVTHG